MEPAQKNKSSFTASDVPGLLPSAHTHAGRNFSDSLGRLGRLERLEKLEEAEDAREAGRTGCQLLDNVLSISFTCWQRITMHCIGVTFHASPKRLEKMEEAGEAGEAGEDANFSTMS